MIVSVSAGSGSFYHVGVADKIFVRFNIESVIIGTNQTVLAEITEMEIVPFFPIK